MSDPRRELADALRMAERGLWDRASATARRVARSALGAADHEAAALALAIDASWQVHAGREEIARSFARARRCIGDDGPPLARATLAVALATTLAWRGRLHEARAIADRTRALWETALPPARRARALGYSAVVRFALGELDVAEELAREAAALADGAGDVRWRVLARALGAWIAAERHEAERAAELASEAASIAELCRDDVAASIVRLVRGEIAFGDCRFDEAIVDLARAAAGLEEAVPRFAVCAWTSLAAALAERGRIEDAAAAELRARRLTSGAPELLRRALELRAMHVALARGEPRSRARALALIRDARSHPTLRTAARALFASLERRAPVVRVARDGAWFELGGERRSLERAPIARRLLEALVEAGSAGCSTSVLLAEMGWHARTEREHVRTTARLYRAIHRLRRTGLGELLASDGERTGLRADVFVEIA